MKIHQDIPLNRIHDLLVSALEGGSNYWYMIENKIKPKGGLSFTDPIWKKEREKDRSFVHISEYPFNKGGAIIFSDMEADEDQDGQKNLRLDLTAIERGLQLFAESKEYSHHWADFLKENDDNATGDVFLQFCLFGDVIYG
jgi:hypothetical protein